MRPIDAYALRNKKKNAIISTRERYGCDVVEYIEIINAPTLDYKDLVPQGEWERVIPSKSAAKWFTKVSCSVCHKGGYERYNFCPNCGARMVSK